MGSAVNTLLQVVVIAVAIANPVVVAGTIQWMAVAKVVGTAVLATALSVKPKVRNSSMQQRTYATETTNRSVMVRS